MRIGQLVEARTPRNGLVKRGRIVAFHETHNGAWVEIAPVYDNDRTIKDAETWRSRPASVTAVK